MHTGYLEEPVSNFKRGLHAALLIGVLCWMILVAGIQLGIHHGRKLQTQDICRAYRLEESDVKMELSRMRCGYGHLYAGAGQPAPEVH